jgi:hypothetical protein
MKKQSNYSTLVLTELEARLAQSDGERPRSEFFDILAAETALRAFVLTPDEIEAGLTDGGGDGGVDAAFTFVNQELISEDHEILADGFEPSPAYRLAAVSLWIIQAKEESTFKRNTLVTIQDGLGDLLDLQKSRSDLTEAGYNQTVLDRVFEYRTVLEKLRLQHPQSSVNVFYVSLGDTGTLAANVEPKRTDLRDALVDAGASEATVSFMGAAEVWRQLELTPTYTSELRVADSVAHETPGNDRSYICLVTLKDYLRFISSHDGSYREHLFEGNVRHYEGERAGVNREITDGLTDPDSPEFWWLNNGVTVICSNASSQGKTFTLDDVQIVNGLQTSRTIHRVLREAPEEHPALSRQVLVRIIESSDAITVNKVIRATNRQTPVRAESLRATDEVQLMIDRHLYQHELYYDRRRNFYKNTGKPRAKVVSVKSLTQSLLAIVHGRPDDARARPGDYLKDDEQYAFLFNPNASLAIYPWVIRFQREVDRWLSTANNMTTVEKNDSRFLVSADLIRGTLGYSPSASEHVLSLGEPESIVTSEKVAESLTALRNAFEADTKKGGLPRDRLSKNKAFSTNFLERARSSAQLK